jgi:aspartokinase
MEQRGLAPADLVAASGEQLTHKQVARAMKGRRLTAHMMDKVVRAWNRATASEAARADLFDYAP